MKKTGMLTKRKDVISMKLIRDVIKCYAMQANQHQIYVCTYYMYVHTRIQNAFSSEVVSPCIRKENNNVVYISQQSIKRNKLNISIF
ncbi:hypothetical protein ALC56_14996 [Trachymyrmex septentrionalis]|uniref:Uncharacterized protein n=1 Tax=Trachymyrmex septentrionalis TaxID=34720 RepID=A0A151JT11_9HYME|nr:hypothetical protein ALC56_14996 [Trachymyrmex septentrionalis]